MTIVESFAETRHVMTRRAVLLLILVITAAVSVAAGYEALDALGAVTVGPLPGETPRGEAAVVALAILALLVAGLLLVASSLVGDAAELVPARLLALLNGAATALVVARFFSYDSYYAPTLRRMSDGGILPGWWIVGVTVFAAGAVWGVFRSPRLGVALTAGALWLCALTVQLAGLGH
jgi:hypothetical protein